MFQLRQIVTMNPANGTTSPGRTPGGTMLRTLGAAQKREVKATQNLSIIVLFFMICWIPLYTINFILAFCDDCFKMNSTLMLFCIILSHLNSAGNPLLYAYHLKDFRAALKSFLLNLFGGKDQEADNGLHQNGRLSLHQHSYYNQRRETRSALTLYPQNGLIPLASSNTSSLTTKSSSLPNETRLASVVSKTTTTLAVIPTVGNRIWRISEVRSASEEPNKKRSGSSTTSSGRINYAFAKGLETTGDDDVFYDNNSACISDIEETEIAIVTNTLKRLRGDRIFSSSPHLAIQDSAPRFKRKVNRSYSVIEYKGSSSSLEEFQKREEMFQSTKHSSRELSDDSGAISDTNKDSGNSSIGVN